MSEDQTLKTLRDSLIEPQKPTVKPPEKAVTMADALLKIPDLVEQLKGFSNKKQQEVDAIKTITQLDFDIKMLTSQTCTNLSQIDKLTKQVNTRIDQLNLIEQKWNSLLQRVDLVLQEIERVLKNY